MKAKMEDMKAIGLVRQLLREVAVQRGESELAGIVDVVRMERQKHDGRHAVLHR